MSAMQSAAATQHGTATMDADIDDPDRAQRLRIFRAIDLELERLERGPSSRVAAVQLDGLRRIAVHAQAQSVFYRDRLAPVLAGGRFDASRWSEIPILTREDVRRNIDALRARDTPDAEYGIRVSETSGSSGTPVRFMWNSMATIATRGAMERLFAWHRLDPDAPLVELRTFMRDSTEPQLREYGQWSFRGRGRRHELNAALPLRRQIASLRRIRPRYLMTYPTLARDLAMTVAHDGGEALRLDAILTVGEVMTERIRRLCAGVFGAVVIDTYGCQEMGKIALECPASGLYHVCAPSVCLEVLDDGGRPVRPGEVGRAIVTSLYNYATPFIRYELGDYVRLASAQCPCGGALPAIAEILGRRRNMLTLPDGDRRWLSGKVLAGFADFVPLRQYRLVQRSHDRLELLYVGDGSGRSMDLEGLRNFVRNHIHPAMEIAVTPQHEIPRSPGGKYEDVVGLDAPDA
jgi:phenylacetate-CoA ligase